MSFVKSYRHHFQSYRHNVTEKARQYASGLMQAGSRKNMDRMAEVVPESKSRNLQQVVTHSKWTMNIGDRLYGVTMQEPGISTLVSVELSGAKSA